MRWTARRALKQWQSDGLLTGDKAAALASRLDGYERRDDSSRAVGVFAIIGAVLTGLGVILFVASNWSGMGPVARALTLLLLYGLVVAGAMAAERRELTGVANAVWLLASLMLGANIFLLAQIFNHSLTYWQGPLLWMIGALAMGYARRSSAQAALAVPLGLLALGWVGGGKGWFMDDQIQFLLSPGGLRPVLPTLGVGLVALSLLVAAREDLSFARRACFRWGCSLVAATLVASTIHFEVAAWLFEIDYTLKQLLVAVATLVLVAGAWKYGRVGSELSRPVLAGGATFSLLLLVPVAGEAWPRFEAGGVHVLFGLYVLTVFAAALGAILLGIRTRSRRLINTGMFSAACLIVIQYFNWSFLLLDRSLVFIFGGVMLIGLAVLLENKRRALMEQLDAPLGSGGA